MSKNGEERSDELRRFFLRGQLDTRRPAIQRIRLIPLIKVSYVKSTPSADSILTRETTTDVRSIPHLFGKENDLSVELEYRCISGFLSAGS